MSEHHLFELKEQVFRANLDLVKYGLVHLTWGNASAITEDRSRIVIKPSGIDYDKMSPTDMVVVDFNGQVIDGKWKPSSDTPTHLCLYQHFPTLGGIVHTHSTWATMFAQARREIPCFGTTHADHFYGPVPLTRPLMKTEVQEEYEKNTGVVIVERFEDRSLRFPINNHIPQPLNPDEVPGVLVAGHGPFSWGPTVEIAVKNAAALEQIAQMAFGTQMLAMERKLCTMSEEFHAHQFAVPLESYVLEKHYHRKHGKNAYYGQ